MAIGQKIVCQRPSCSVGFIQKTHNNIFCSDECCKIQTNERLVKEYRENKDRKRGIVRFCSVCEFTKLSRYNETKVCSSCEAGRKSSANKLVLDIFSQVM